MARQWYILQVHSGFEERVKATLEERIAKEGLEEFFGQILVPTEQVVEMIKGSRKTSSRRFFPGYMLVSMTLSKPLSEKTDFGRLRTCSKPKTLCVNRS